MLGLPLLRTAPNRLVSGEAVSFFTLIHGPVWGAVAALGLVILDDPKGVQPIYAPAPLVREAALKQNPKIADALAPVFKLLDGPTLQSLNAKIQLEGQDAKKVASDFLKSKGLLK